MTNGSPIKIFYADDDEDDRSFFDSALSKIDKPVELHCFPDGLMMEKALEENHYNCDLVFLDLNMPGRSGLETLATLKKPIEKSDLKVIIFTTSADEALIRKTHDQKAVLYVQKPDNMKSLTSLLKEIIDKRESFKLPVPFESFYFKKKYA
ncbi:MAG: response regulator [Chitinophagaceae bacterium]